MLAVSNKGSKTPTETEGLKTPPPETAYKETKRPSIEEILGLPLQDIYNRYAGEPKQLAKEVAELFSNKDKNLLAKLFGNKDLLQKKVEENKPLASLVVMMFRYLEYLKELGKHDSDEAKPVINAYERFNDAYDKAIKSIQQQPDSPLKTAILNAIKDLNAQVQSTQPAVIYNMRKMYGGRAPKGMAAVIATFATAYKKAERRAEEAKKERDEAIKKYGQEVYEKAEKWTADFVYEFAKAYKALK
jgi:hypothetical protein